MGDSTSTARAIMSAAELDAHKAGEHGRDYRLSDDGYGDMEVAERRGWTTISSWGHDGWDLGDWPYVVISTRTTNASNTGQYELQQVCEGDHTRYQFDNAADREAAIDYLFLWYAAGESWAPLAYEDRARLDAGEVEVPERFRGPCRV